MSIITGRGDLGLTDLMFSKRIPKTSLRVEALGCVDELNAALGLARAAEANPEIVTIVDGIQARLVGMMGQLATLPEDEAKYMAKKYAYLSPEDLDWVTDTAHDYEKRGIRFTGWERPGAEGSMARAALDFSRSVARRAERAVLSLHESGDEVPNVVRLFFNRISDLLWILARAENPETRPN
jgi:cob(I)alamin adenosyltransferase